MNLYFLEIAFCENVDNGAKYLQEWKMYIAHCTMIFNDGNFDDAKSDCAVTMLIPLYCQERRTKSKLRFARNKAMNHV